MNFFKDNELLTEEDKKFLARLGLVKAVEKKTTTVKKKPAIVPYKLQVSELCSTCGGQKEKYYNMVETADRAGLCSVTTTDETMTKKDKMMIRSVKVCSSCNEYLQTKTKDELIWMYIQEKLKV